MMATKPGYRKLVNLVDDHRMSVAKDSSVREDWDRTLCRLRPFPLAFDDSRFEKLFQAKWFKATRRANFAWKLISFVGYVVLSGLIAVAASPGFLEFQWFRFLVCIPLQFFSVALALIPTINNAYYYYWLFLVTSLATFGNALYSFHFSVPADSIMYLYECAVVYVFCHSFFPARWSQIAPFSLLATACALVTFSTLDPTAQISNLPLDLLLFATIGMACTCNSICYAKEEMARRNFQQIRRSRILSRRADKLASRAQQATEAKARFLAVAAHELRTPLNGMSGYAELICYGAAGPDTPEWLRAKSANIQNHARHLNDLVEMILEITNARSGQDNRQVEQIEIAGILQDAIDGAIRRGVAVIADDRSNLTEPGFVVSELRTLRLILDNLIDLGSQRKADQETMQLTVSPATGHGIRFSLLFASDLRSGDTQRLEGQGIEVIVGSLTMQMIKRLEARLDLTTAENGQTAVSLLVPDKHSREVGSLADRAGSGRETLQRLSA